MDNYIIFFLTILSFWAIVKISNSIMVKIGLIDE